MYQPTVLWPRPWPASCSQQAVLGARKHGTETAALSQSVWRVVWLLLIQWLRYLLYSINVQLFILLLGIAFYFTMTLWGNNKPKIFKCIFNEKLSTKFPFLKKIDNEWETHTKCLPAFTLHHGSQSDVTVPTWQPEDTNMLKKRQYLLQKLVVILRRICPKKTCSFRRQTYISLCEMWFSFRSNDYS